MNDVIIYSALVTKFRVPNETTSTFLKERFIKFEQEGHICCTTFKTFETID